MRYRRNKIQKTPTGIRQNIKQLSSRHWASIRLSVARFMTSCTLKIASGLGPRWSHSSGIEVSHSRVLIVNKFISQNN